MHFRRCLLVLLGAVVTCLPCGASESSAEVLSASLTGKVFSKQKGEPLEDALVILAEAVKENDRVRYSDITSVVTDSGGRFLFADPRLWEKKRNLALLVWKRLFSWQAHEIPERFYNESRKEPVQIYLAPLVLEGRTCPKCSAAPASHRVSIFYATDRQPGVLSPLTFLNRPDPQEQLHYGLCDAGIEVLSNEDLVAVDKGFVNGLYAYASTKELFSAVAASHSSGVMVFIHGYQNSFAEACATAAQVAYDTGFDGVTMIFSWPSQDEVLGYWTDEDRVRWSSPHLKRFLAELSSAVGLHIHILAHSMGNRALLSAITAPVGLPRPQWHLGEILFAAPDVESGDFRNQLSLGIDAHRATLYASSGDMALAASKLFHLWHKRAGDSEPEIDTLPNLDSIDASRVDTSLLGHSYYSTSWSVLEDLHFVIHDDMPPDKRFGLIAGKTRGGNRYWIIAP